MATGPHGAGAGAAGADGTWTGTFTVVGSSVYGRFAPHFNFGYTASGQGEVANVPDEVGYRFGTEFVASPRATLHALPHALCC